MRRLLVVLLVAACLLPEAGLVRAQATTDQMDRLSLEALTTPAPGGNPGPYRRASRRSSYRDASQGQRSYARHSATRNARGYRTASRSSSRGYGTSRSYQARTTRQDGNRGSVRRSFHGRRHHATTHRRRRHR